MADAMTAADRAREDTAVKVWSDGEDLGATLIECAAFRDGYRARDKEAQAEREQLRERIQAEYCSLCDRSNRGNSEGHYARADELDIRADALDWVLSLMKGENK